jgi:acetyltransferase-like isoleucine patch superfamily enzyme
LPTAPAAASPPPSRDRAPHFAHPDSLVEAAEIGPGTRIWAFAHVLAGARLGADCNICDHTFIEGGAVVGDRVTLKCGVQLWEGVTLEDDVFVGPNATFTNDLFPRSRKRPAAFTRTLVRAGASIGANATILPGVIVGSRAMVGAGAVVTRDVPPLAIVVGNPAVVTGYVDAHAAGGEARLRPRPPAAREIRPGQRVTATALIGGASLVELPRISDARGHLSFGEMHQSLPFAPARYFLVFGVPSREVRGEHAHRELHQFLIAVHGSVAVRLFDGHASDEVTLDRPELGLHVPPLLWTTQYKYSPDAVLLVLASDIYRESDYVRGADEYQALVAAHERAADRPAALVAQAPAG